MSPCKILAGWEAKGKVGEEGEEGATGRKKSRQMWNCH
jgi:hypothetical protein